MIFKKLKWPILILHNWKRVHTKASSKIKRLGRSVSQRRMPRETEKPPLTMIDEKPTDGTSTSKKDQDGHGMMKSKNFERVPNPDDELKNFFCQDGHGVMNVDFFRQIFSGFRTHVVATTVCTTGVYIHSLVARTFFCCTVCPRTSAHLHACAHTRMAQVSVKRCLLHVSFLCISLSPFSCLTHLCCSRTVTSRPLPTTTSLTIPSTCSCRTCLS